MKVLTPLALGIALVAALPATAHAAKVSRTVLKEFFQTGDVPTQEQFASLIDSFLNYNDDGLTSYGMIVDSSSHAALLHEGDIVDGSKTFAPLTGTGATIPLMAPNFAGQSGYLGMQWQDSIGTPIYGYFQLSMDPDTGPTTTGIHVDYFVFESSGAGITVAPVPEPASLALLGIGGAFLLRRRR